MASNKVGVRFTETMYGPFSDGPQPGTELRFLLTVATDDAISNLADSRQRLLATSFRRPNSIVRSQPP